jgi:hypothetical protein
LFKELNKKEEIMWENMVIHMLLGVLQTLIKNPAHKNEFKQILLLVRDTINEMYPS